MECKDCGQQVVYNDQGFWPWRGKDGCDICPGEPKATYQFGHRLWRSDADQVFARFQRYTGRRARHDI